MSVDVRGKPVTEAQAPLTAEYYRKRTEQAERIEAAGRGVNWVLLVSGSLLFMLPYYVMVAMSLKTPGELAATAAWAWPVNPTLDNYIEVLTNPNVVISLLLKNTTFIAAVSTFGTVMSSALVAYGFARIDFVGRDRLFMILLSTMMLPGVVTMIPSYILMAKLNWVNTLYPLTVPSFFAAAFNVFLLRQFFKGIPRELDEAAILDGANHWIIFWRVIMPLSGAALATITIFSLIGAWRDFMGPLLYLNNPQLQTLELGLQSYRSLNSDQWHLISAFSTLVSIPLIVLFFVGQKWFSKGITMTGLK